MTFTARGGLLLTEGEKRAETEHDAIANTLAERSVGLMFRGLHVGQWG